MISWPPGCLDTVPTPTDLVAEVRKLDGLEYYQGGATKQFNAAAAIAQDTSPMMLDSIESCLAWARAPPPPIQQALAVEGKTLPVEQLAAIRAFTGESGLCYLLRHLSVNRASVDATKVEENSLDS